MAQGGNEHRMVFDIRGKRRHVVKVVYAILAILMGLSLFLVTGARQPRQPLRKRQQASTAPPPGWKNSPNGSSAKSDKDPENPSLLLALTRAQINAGNSQRPSTQKPARANSHRKSGSRNSQRASESWSHYLKRPTNRAPTPPASSPGRSSPWPTAGQQHRRNASRTSKRRRRRSRSSSTSGRP